MDTQIIIYGIVNAGLAFVEGAAFIGSPTGVAVLSTKAELASPRSNAKLEEGLTIPYRAPAFEKVEGWINSEPFTMDSLKGKVVLIDFWTYSCINCIRTLPYLKDWYAKYHDQGFVVVGVHTPEFEFEKNSDNVKQAVSQFGITYPVILDSHFGTWQNFKNQYWPAHYLIDKNGMVVYEHFGEGQYDTTEHNIVALLGVKEKQNASHESRMSFNFSQTPETYLGYARSRSYSGQESIARDTTMNYEFPNSIPQDGWALQGKWLINSDKITAEETGAQLKLHFFSKKVYIVMGSQNNKPLSVKVLLNDKPIDSVNITRPMLYEVVHLQTADSGIVTLIPESAGVEFFAFTFGN